MSLSEIVCVCSREIVRSDTSTANIMHYGFCGARGTENDGDPQRKYKKGEDTEGYCSEQCRDKAEREEDEEDVSGKESDEEEVQQKSSKRKSKEASLQQLENKKR